MKRRLFVSRDVSIARSPGLLARCDGERVADAEPKNEVGGCLAVVIDRWGGSFVWIVADVLYGSRSSLGKIPNGDLKNDTKFGLPQGKLKKIQRAAIPWEPVRSRPCNRLASPAKLPTADHPTGHSGTSPTRIAGSCPRVTGSLPDTTARSR